MRILVVDDEEMLAEALADSLRELGHQVRTAYSGEAGLAAAAAEAPDLVLSDLGLPDANGVDLLPRWQQLAPRATLVIMTGSGTTAQAVKAMKNGAEDYLEKPFDFDHLSALVHRLDRHRGLTLDLEALRSTRAQEAADALKVHMGEGMRGVYDELTLASEQDHLTVLLLGETGTGKEHAAHLLHRLSRRYAGPFIEVNCAALPESLIEAELFGSEAGSFTDAKRRRLGVFEAAEGGTLFLDEVGELSAPAQAKLLKVLEERTLRRVGGSESVRVDLRVVAATNRDLAAEAKAGRFRADLYYRLSLFTVQLPALREHRQDIPALAAHLFERACSEFGRRLAPLTQAQIHDLSRRPWPGNVRELRNTLEGAVLRARDGRATWPSGTAAEDPLPDAGPPGAIRPLKEAVDEATQAVKRRWLQRALEASQGNKSAAARLLQVDIKTIHNLARDLGLDLEAWDGG
jgi:two-component system response regulator HydG